MGIPNLRVNAAMVKRHLKARGEQHKGSPCIVCGKNFDDCRHSLNEVATVSMAINVALLLDIKPWEKP